MPKSILAILTVVCTQTWGTLNLPATATQNRSQVNVTTNHRIALAGRSCGARRYTRNRYRH